MISRSFHNSGSSFWRHLCSKVVNLAPNRFALLSSSCWTQLPKSTITISFHSSFIPVGGSNFFQTYSNNFSTMSTSKPILYSYYRSSASWRVRILLAYKGIDYSCKSVNLLHKEQVGEDYLKLNPLGQVPALVYDGKTIIQSMVIMEFLEEIFPQNSMIPKDPFLKAKVREICEIISAGIQPLQNLSVILKISDEQEKRVEWANFWITKGFTALEKVLSASSGKYCVGDEVTLADCCLAPQIHQAERFKVDVEAFPNISRIGKSLSDLEAFKTAHAFAQPDCPPELRK